MRTICKLFEPNRYHLDKLFFALFISNLWNEPNALGDRPIVGDNEQRSCLIIAENWSCRLIGYQGAERLDEQGGGRCPGTQGVDQGAQRSGAP